MATELSNSDYTTHFTKELAPEQKAFVVELNTAKAWSQEVAKAEEWLAYAKVQRDRSWFNVFATLKIFRPIFEAVMTAKPTLADKYQQTKAFLLVWKVVAERAVATKAAKKKAEKAAKKAEGK